MALNILLCIEASGSPSANDSHIKTLLEGAGHTVTYQTGSATLPSPITAYDVFIATYPQTTGLNSGYASAAIPGISTDRSSWATLNMSTGVRSNGSGTAIVVLTDSGSGDGDGHPIAVAAGLSAGSETFYSTSTAISRDDVYGSGAVPIAYHFNSAWYTLWGYDPGATMYSGTAPDYRWAFGPYQAQYWTTLADDTFVAMVQYVTDTLNPSSGSAGALAGEGGLIGNGLAGGSGVLARSMEKLGHLCLPLNKITRPRLIMPVGAVLQGAR